MHFISMTININISTMIQNPMNAEDSKTLCCLCCASGPIVGKHSVPKLGYVPGEALPIKAECINHSSRNGEIFMELIQVYILLQSILKFD